MIDTLWTVIIFPIVKVIELCYLLVFRVFDNPAAAFLGVSAAVSVLTLPLYFRAEKWQHIERGIQKRLAPKTAKIKAVFKGDERYMILSAYYRQNRYHPVYALRNSFGILIQIPFFIAAYSYLSHLEILQGAGFLYIHDLSKPDALLPLGGLSLNILPILMTFINVVSGAIYTKNLAVKDRIQVYGMAAVFLLLLYHSPAGLVLYWTMNNVFSLAKNILQKTKHSKKIIYIGLCVCAGLFDIYVLFFHDGYILKRLIAACAVTPVFFTPLFGRLLRFLGGKIRALPLERGAISNGKTFIFAAASLFLLTGVVIPSGLIASSAAEFSFIENNTAPFPFILTPALQAGGMFLFWPLCIFFLFSNKIKKILSAVFVFWCAAALAGTFLFPGNYGFLTNTLILSNPGTWSGNPVLIMVNCAVLVILVPVLLFLLLSAHTKKLFFAMQTIALLALFSFGVVNIAAVNREYNELARQTAGNSGTKTLSPVYTLSKNGRNVVVIMLDRGISGFVPYLFKEKPELNGMWNGFTWYPNCAAFAGWTLYGVPALAGGYEYTPLGMQKNPAKPLVEKHNEALLLMPRIFSDAGYTVTVTDPSWANYGWSPDVSIFNAYPKIHAENIASSYIDYWLNKHPDITALSITDILKERLIRFSFFKTAPLMLRLFIYDRGDWLTVNDRDLREGRNELTVNMIGKYAALEYLPELTAFDTDKPGSLLMIYNELTHDPAFLQPPDYVPVQVVTNKGTSPFADNAHYHVDMAAFLLLGKWFNLLKDNGIYDNTKIIIVSDHGYNIDTGNNSFILSNGDLLEKYTSLLMVKDFNETGTLKTDKAFMTQADVPLLAFEGIIDTPVNPFTGVPLRNDKGNGVTITTSGKFYPTNHGKYTFSIAGDEWLHVHDDIFKTENWSAVSK